MRPTKHHPALAGVLVAGTLLAAPALAQTVPPAMISVSGEASVSVPPDLAQVDAGVTSEAKTAREASEANNAAMAKVLLALKGRRHRPERISRLRGCRCSRKMRRTAHRPAAIVSYRASNRVTVRVHDVTKVANVIDTLVGAGANDIGGINFIVSEASKLLDEAREQAVADARRKAEIYAKAAGVTLGAPLSISEGGGAPHANGSAPRWHGGRQRRHAGGAGRRDALRSR